MPGARCEEKTQDPRFRRRRIRHGVRPDPQRCGRSRCRDAGRVAGDDDSAGAESSEVSLALRLAVRSLATRPVRSAVLSCGFGFGIAVMAALLGVGEVIVDQARAPDLVGGGEVVVSGGAGAVTSARFLTANLLAFREPPRRVRAVSPAVRSTVYLRRGRSVTAVRVRGGIPSLEKAVGDPEVSRI